MWEKLEKKDYKAALGYLEKHSPFTCPIYGNAASAGFAYKPFAMRSGFYFIYKELGQILGVAAGYNDGNVMIHTISQQADETVLEIFDELPFHSVWGLTGKLPGLREVSMAAGKAFDSRRLDVMAMKGRTGNGVHPECELMRIDRRFLGTSYVSFIKKCLWEGFGFKSSSLDIRKRMKERCEVEPYWFLADGKKYVAQAHVQAMTPKPWLYRRHMHAARIQEEGIREGDSNARLRIYLLKGQDTRPFRVGCKQACVCAL